MRRAARRRVEPDRPAPRTFWREYPGIRHRGDPQVEEQPILLHAFTRREHGGYDSLCGHYMHLIGGGSAVNRPQASARCRKCDVAEQKLHMTWTPLPATVDIGGTPR